MRWKCINFCGIKKSFSTTGLFFSYSLFPNARWVYVKRSVQYVIRHYHATKWAPFFATNNSAWNIINFSQYLPALIVSYFVVTYSGLKWFIFVVNHWIVNINNLRWKDCSRDYAGPDWFIINYNLLFLI